MFKRKLSEIDSHEREELFPEYGNGNTNISNIFNINENYLDQLFPLEQPFQSQIFIPSQPAFLLVKHIPVQNALQSYIDAHGSNKSGIHPKNMALIHAVTRKDITMVRNLITAHANANSHPFNNPLHVAAKNGSIEIMTILLESFPDSVNTFTRCGHTPLHIAAQEGRKGMLDLLISKGADLNIKVKNGYFTPLHIATQHRKNVIIQSLITAGADIDAGGVEKHTPLMLSMKIGYQEGFQLLIAANARTDIKSFDEKTLLHLCTTANMVTTLIKKGMDINAKDSTGKTPLHRAIEKSNEEVVCQLLEMPLINVNIQNTTGETPFNYAFNPNNIACINPNHNIIMSLIRSGVDVNIPNLQGDSPLHRAVCRSNLNLIDTSLKAGAHVTAADLNGNTPLHYAALNSRSEVLAYLLENFPTHLLPTAINAANRNGITPIVYAFEQGHFRNVENLQLRGAILPAHLVEHRQQPGINGKQSIHTVTVHVSASKSAKALFEYYRNSDLKQARNALIRWGDTLSTQNLQSRAARNCLRRVPLLNYRDARSGLNLQQILGILWLAFNDLSYNPKIMSSSNDPHITPDQLKQIHEKILKERYETLVNFLYEAQRGYNINEQNIDDNDPRDKPICCGGHFNKFIESLNGVHPSVNIILVNDDTICTKGRALINSEFIALPDDEKTTYCMQWTAQTGVPEALVQILRENIGAKLHAEFDKFAEDVPHYVRVIPEFLDMIEYTTPTPAVIAWKQKHLEQQEEKSRPVFSK